MIHNLKTSTFFYKDDFIIQNNLNKSNFPLLLQIDLPSQLLLNLIIIQLILMQECRLPKVIHHIQNKKTSLFIGNKYRYRKGLMQKKFDCIDHSIQLPNQASMQQLLKTSINNINITPKKRSLYGCVEHLSHAQPHNFNKKVFIFNQKSLDSKQNDISDLKTCKSLLNTKTKTPKKILFLFTNKKHQSNRYCDHSLQSLWDLNYQSQSDNCIKLQKKDDFSIQPWNNLDDQKQNEENYA